MPESEVLSRAQGCLLGQFCGDSLGSLAEFESSEEIQRDYPEGVREMRDGRTFHTIAGQPTDDSEMALMLARSIVELGRYDEAAVLARYRYWLSTGPFDCGLTVGAALRGRFNPESQANGALMRVSPIGIFGAPQPLEAVAAMAQADARLTHPNLVCQQVNALFVMALASAIQKRSTPDELYGRILGWAEKQQAHESVLRCIGLAEKAAPENTRDRQGWVLIAFGNALFQMLHASNLEEGIVRSVMLGGDTDTNAAIAGALSGAVFGISAVPERWIWTIEHCRPAEGLSSVRRPRPEPFWPVDVLSLAQSLLEAGERV